MTNTREERKKITGTARVRRCLSAWFTVLIATAVFLLSLFASDKISHSVRSALSLCKSVIIPSVFPFMIISDFLYSYLNFSSMDMLGDIFERCFKINRAGLYPFVLGALCGFPLGVRCAAELYRESRITKDEAERLIGFCNNTGPAFLVSGVGLGLRGSIKDGLTLYFTMLISAVLVGILFSIGHSLCNSSDASFTAYSFSLTRSVKNAGIGTLNVCSYLTFFACIVGLLRNLIGENIVYLSILPFLEVGSACSILSKTALLTRAGSLCLSACAVGFSGLSVHLQALSFIADTDIGAKRYFLMKLTQGATCIFLTFTASFIFF